MKNLKISQKLIVSFGTILVLSVALVILSITALRSIGDKSHQMYEGPFVAATEGMSVAEKMYNVWGSLNAALVEEDLAKYADRINESATEVVAASTSFRRFPELPAVPYRSFWMTAAMPRLLSGRS